MALQTSREYEGIWLRAALQVVVESEVQKFVESRSLCVLAERLDMEGPSTISISSDELASEACVDLRRFLDLPFSTFELPLSR